MVFAGPPRARAQPLAGGGNKPIFTGVPRPDETAIPGRHFGHAGLAPILNRDGLGLARLLLFGQRNEMRVAFRAHLKFLSVLRGANQLQGLLQINLHRLRRPQHPVPDSVAPADGAVGGVDPYLQVVVRQIPPGTFGRQRTA